MAEIQSGQELCDQFFESLTGRKDIDRRIGELTSKEGYHVNT